MERPDKQRRKLLRDRCKAAQNAEARRRWLADTGSLVVFELLVLIPVCVFFALFLGFQLVRKQILSDIWRQGRFTDLVWIATGGLIGAGLVFLWGKLRRKKESLKIGVWMGAIVGAAVVAPTTVLVAILPSAVVYSLLLAFALVATIAGMECSLFRPSAASSLLGGAGAGAVMGAVLWLISRILAAPAEAAQAGLGESFREVLARLADNVTGLGTFVSAVAMGILGAVFLWRLDRKERTASGKA